MKTLAPRNFAAANKNTKSVMQKMKQHCDKLIQQ